MSILSTALSAVYKKEEETKIALAGKEESCGSGKATWPLVNESIET